LSLCEKYRPMKIADFVGLAKPKLLLQKLAVSPNCRALLFEGKSGSGKTAMALAFALDHVLWVFTGVPSDRLEDGFRSRCLQLEFSTYGNSKAAAELLERVWQAEVPNAPPPNFARLIKEANGNILAALQQMELKLMAV